MRGLSRPLGCTLLLAFLFGIACARQPGAAARPPVAPPAARIDTLPIDTFRARHAVHPIRFSNAFRNAIARSPIQLHVRPQVDDHSRWNLKSV